MTPPHPDDARGRGTASPASCHVSRSRRLEPTHLAWVTLLWSTALRAVSIGGVGGTTTSVARTPTTRGLFPSRQASDHVRLSSANCRTLPAIAYILPPRRGGWPLGPTLAPGWPQPSRGHLHPGVSGSNRSHAFRTTRRSAHVTAGIQARSKMAAVARAVGDKASIKVSGLIRTSVSGSPARFSRRGAAARRGPAYP